MDECMRETAYTLRDKLDRSLRKTIGHSDTITRLQMLDLFQRGTGADVIKPVYETKLICQLGPCYS